MGRSERLGVIDVPKIWIEDMSKELQDALERKPVLALGVLGAARMAARGLGEATSTDPMEVETPRQVLGKKRKGEEQPLRQPEATVGEKEDEKYAKATKSDDAGTDTWLWDRPLVLEYS